MKHFLLSDINHEVSTHTPRYSENFIFFQCEKQNIIRNTFQFQLYPNAENSFEQIQAAQMCALSEIPNKNESFEFYHQYLNLE